jgi:hypothetical protein
MKPEEIYLSDWSRILIGEVPGSFYLEAIIRVVFIYLLLLVAMRLMGNHYYWLPAFYCVASVSPP